MANACIDVVDKEDDVGAQNSDAKPGVMVPSKVHLNEDKLFVQLGDNKGSSVRWVQDIGVMNHMTSERAAFSSLDIDVCGTVHFSDGFVTAIQGKGMILFKCRNSAHKALDGVYLIPRLTSNIVSLGQLEEGDHKILLLHERLRI